MSTDQPITFEEVVRVANQTILLHWRRPSEPWRRMCAECTDAGCRRLDRAESLLAHLSNQ